MLVYFIEELKMPKLFLSCKYSWSILILSAMILSAPAARAWDETTEYDYLSNPANAGNADFRSRLRDYVLHTDTSLSRETYDARNDLLQELLLAKGDLINQANRRRGALHESEVLGTTEATAGVEVNDYTSYFRHSGGENYIASWIEKLEKWIDEGAQRTRIINVQQIHQQHWTDLMLREHVVTKAYYGELIEAFVGSMSSSALQDSRVLFFSRFLRQHGKSVPALAKPGLMSKIFELAFAAGNVPICIEAFGILKSGAIEGAEAIVREISDFILSNRVYQAVNGNAFDRKLFALAIREYRGTEVKGAWIEAYREMLNGVARPDNAFFLETEFNSDLDVFRGVPDAIAGPFFTKAILPFYLNWMNPKMVRNPLGNLERPFSEHLHLRALALLYSSWRLQSAAVRNNPTRAAQFLRQWMIENPHCLVAQKNVVKALASGR